MKIGDNDKFDLSKDSKTHAEWLYSNSDEYNDLKNKIKAADDPAFAAKALLAASKGWGTIDALFEDVLNAGKDLKYYEEIDKELKNQGTSLLELAGSEYMKPTRNIVDNKFYKQFWANQAALDKKYSTTESAFVYSDANNNYYIYSLDTYMFEIVDKYNPKDGSYEIDGVKYDKDGNKVEEEE